MKRFLICIAAILFLVSAAEAGQHLCEERLLRCGGEPGGQPVPDSFAEEHGRGDRHAAGGNDGAGRPVPDPAEGTALPEIHRLCRDIRGDRRRDAGLRAAGGEAARG